MRTTPLPADFIYARTCKLKCEKFLTRPTDFLPPGFFFRRAILSGHMYNLLCDASILHHSGGLHIIEEASKLTAFLIRLCPVDNIAFSGWLNYLWKGFSYHKNTAPALWSRGCVFLWQHFGQYL